MVDAVPATNCNDGTLCVPPVITIWLLNVFTPAIVCVPVVTSPRAVALASGMLKVCVVPVEEIAKSVPAVPTANVCVAPVSALSELIPPETVHDLSAERSYAVPLIVSCLLVGTAPISLGASASDPPVACDVLCADGANVEGMPVRLL